MGFRFFFNKYNSKGISPHLCISVLKHIFQNVSKLTSSTFHFQQPLLYGKFDQPSLYSGTQRFWHPCLSQFCSQTMAHTVSIQCAGSVLANCKALKTHYFYHLLLTLSTVAISPENRLRIRPTGVVSKNLKKIITVIIILSHTPCTIGSYLFA